MPTAARPVPADEGARVRAVSRRRPGAQGRRRPGPGWVPREHGAWAMLVVPVVVGALVATLVVTATVLLVVR